VIGFGMHNAKDEDTWSLQAIASASGGHFFTANSADELRKAIGATVGTTYRVLEGNDVVARGVLGSIEPMFFPKGDYRIELDSVPPHEVAFSLNARDDLTLMLEKQEGVISHTEYRDLMEPTSCEEAIAATRRSRQESAPEFSSVPSPARNWPTPPG
jgi:hypothetical protein